MSFSFFEKAPENISYFYSLTPEKMGILSFTSQCLCNLCYGEETKRKYKKKLNMEVLQPVQQSTGLVTKCVTLYDNGYAVFEQEATILGCGSLDLFFSSTHMQSVLDSIQFLGEGSSKVHTIAYEVTKPTASIDLQSDNPLVNLLKSLVGRLISFVFISKNGADEKAEGKLLGVDEIILSGSDYEKVSHVSILTEGKKVITVPIQSCHSFNIMESQAHDDIAFSLDLKCNSSANDLQKLSVFYSYTSTPLQLRVRYSFHVKEWTSSYRMRQSDHPNLFHLEGLAIIENTLDEDWNDVRLTLVVGAPTVERSDVTTMDEGMWQLKIKSLTGPYVTVRANPKDSIIAVKSKVAKKLCVPLGSFCLRFSGKPIGEGRVLSDYPIDNHTLLHME